MPRKKMTPEEYLARSEDKASYRKDQRKAYLARHHDEIVAKTKEYRARKKAERKLLKDAVDQRNAERHVAEGKTSTPILHKSPPSGLTVEEYRRAYSRRRTAERRATKAAWLAAKGEG